MLNEDARSCPDQSTLAPAGGGSARAGERKGGRLVSAAYPHLVKLVHPTKNGDLDVGSLTAGSGRRIWWLCSKGDDHEWPATVANITRPNSGCPFCANKKVSKTNSLATLYAQVAGQWHPTKNGTDTPDAIVAGSNKQVWWQCGKGDDHEWRTRVVDRTADGTGCPFCANKKVSKTNSLATLYPQVAAQWHPTKNGELTPAKVTAGSASVVWWRCGNGPDHEWSTRVVDRTTIGSGCPFCANQRVSVTNCLATLFPDVAAQLDRKLNDGLTPDEVIAGSNKPVWWRCPKGLDHTWPVAPVYRTFGGTGCPYCVGVRVSQTNSLAALFPNLAAQWHSIKNGQLRADGITAYSNKLVWWQCARGPDHEWEAPPNNRAAGGNGCPCCANKKVSTTNSLATLHPALAAQMRPELNDGLTAEDVVASSTQRVTWRCDEGPDHEWTTAVLARTSNDAGCPACAGRQASVTNSLAGLYPDVAAQWHPTRNGTLTPDQVVATSSTTRAWWRCDKGSDHEWPAMVHTRTKLRTGCPSCAGIRVSETNSLAALFPEIAAQWHPTLNEGRTANQIVAGSGEAVWWRCDMGPDHEWATSVDKRTREGTGCPACANRQVSQTNSLETLYPHIAVQLDPDLNDGRTPDQVVAVSEEVLIWHCPCGPDHIWPARVYTRTVRGTGCPCCAGMKLSETNSLAALFPEIAAEMDTTLNGDRTANQVLAGTHERISWRCRHNPDHVWVATVANRTRGDRNCPTCAVTGYKRSRPGFVYLLRREWYGREQRKIGITNDPKDRIATLRRFGWERIEVSGSLDGAVAGDIEAGFLGVLTDRGIRRIRGVVTDAEREDGYTETWDYEQFPIDSMEQVLQAVQARGIAESLFRVAPW